MRFVANWHPETGVIELAWLPKENEFKDAQIIHLYPDKGRTIMVNPKVVMGRGETEHDAYAARCGVYDYRR